LAQRKAVSTLLKAAEKARIRPYDPLAASTGYTVDHGRQRAEPCATEGIRSTRRVRWRDTPARRPNILVSARQAGHAERFCSQSGHHLPKFAQFAWSANKFARFACAPNKLGNSLRMSTPEGATHAAVRG
jgi:hypothetical protein